MSTDPDIAAFRQRAALLLERQLRGEAPPPGEISEERLAQELGLSRRKIRRLFFRAVTRITRALEEHPDLHP